MKFNPITTRSRIEVVDALRGFALLGIIIANIPFASTAASMEDQRLLMPGAVEIDNLLVVLYSWFVDKKFITIFSMLFGFGFYIQYTRAKSKDLDFTPYFMWRMFLLLLIGAVHAYIIWYGDIIRDYAICGMLLLLFRKWSLSKILTTGIVLGVIGTGIIFILNGVFDMHSTYRYDLGLLKELEIAPNYWRYWIVNFTIDPFVNFIHDTPLTLSFALGCMLIGIWLGKTEFFKHPQKHRKLMKYLMTLGFTVGVAGSITYWMVINGKLELSLPIIWLVFLIIGAMLLQSLAYVSLFVWLYEYTGIKRILKVFVPVGRMALSNYILQSIFYTIFFFHWFPGLRLFGKITIAETYLIGIALFGIQIIVSQWWLKHHAQGPLEMLWKKWSYKPINKKKIPKPSVSIN